MPQPYIPYVYIKDLDMVAPKDSILTMPLGQARRFEPLPSARRRRFIRTEDDLRAWLADAPGETFANEVVVNPTGAWPNVALVPPAPGLTEVLRLTLPRPEPISLVLHPWVNDISRFRQSIRMYAELASTNFPAMFAINGRVFVEFGVGQARNWTYLDAAPGGLQIPNATWLAVSAWSHTTAFRLAATAQVGYSHGPLDATWSQTVVDNIQSGIVRQPPHYSRDVTGYFHCPGDLAGVGNLWLQDGLLNVFQHFLMRSAVTPNPQVIPYAPVKIPLAGGVALINNQIFNPGAPAVQCSCTSVCTVRL